MISLKTLLMVDVQLLPLPVLVLIGVLRPNNFVFSFVNLKLERKQVFLTARFDYHQRSRYLVRVKVDRPM